jgi:serine/threonine-protein kinase
MDEAKLVAGLDHPHIAFVYDMGSADGSHFFAMEYVHGKDLRSTLRRTALQKGQFPIGAAVQIARDVASALHHAHERRDADGKLLNIVHRDVSPSNVLVSYEGAVKLADFGVAKAASQSNKTRTGMLKGKVSYMSPEQAKGAPIDRRSDVFSLGIVLWEMITTHRLFRGLPAMTGEECAVECVDCFGTDRLVRESFDLGRRHRPTAPQRKSSQIAKRSA